MSQKLLLEELQKGPSSWNDWRRVHPSVRIDLSGAYLAESSLRGYDLRRADLSGATLMAADLTGADLREANLATADLRFANFSGAQLAGAHFHGTIGVTPRMLKDSLPEADVSRRRQLWIVAGVIAALAMFAYWREPSVLSNVLPAASPATNAAVDPEGRLADYERFTQQVQKAEFAGWRIETVDVMDDLVTLRINRDQVSDDSYLLTLAAACGALLEAPDAPVRMIRVLGRDGASGWVYENPSNCAALLQAPLATQRLAAAANSRPFVPGLDYSQP
ncbi:MAG: pentapeptide repeat-containing protein [Acidobacteria bacterium]|nr:pentapeptide repeat-containing protein [Acidobacteriota bacterium]MDA1236377.1 pentapeptide repeat-containing protein [Acidobacteriota bacterium]